MRRRAVVAAGLVAGLSSLAVVPQANGQGTRAAPEAALVSVGGQVGSLGGFTLRAPARTPASWVVTLGFDGTDRAVLGGGRQIETRLPGSPLRVFATPGAFVSAGDGRMSGGVNTGLGFGFYRHRYDVYVAAVPTLALVGRVDVRVDLGAGIRYAL